MQKNIIRLFWNAAAAYPRYLLVNLINPIITVLAGAFAGPFIVSILLGQLQAGTLTLDSSWGLIGLYALAQLYGEVLGWRASLYANWMMQTSAERDLYQRVFSHLSQLDLSFHANRFSGSLVSQTNKLTGAFERFWDTVTFQIIPTLTSIIASVTILSFFFWQYAAFLAGMSVIFAAFVIWSSRFMAKLNTREAQASTAMSGHIADMITNVMAVKANSAERRELETATSVANNWRDRSRDTMWGFLKVSTGYSVMLVIINMTALIGAIWAAEQHTISIGTIYLALTYTITVGRQLWEINNIMRNYNRIMGDANDMAEILAISPAIADPSSSTLAIGKGVIDFTDVTFAHDGAEQLFEHFTLHIPAGQKVGLVGHSGSGKSTLTRLLLRFSDIESGEVLIDDQNIAAVTQASLREAIAYVPQEPLLFHRSLRENITYGRPDATEKEVISAAKKAHAYEFISKLPDGFDTLVGERGVKLSGGQRQRIAIARAILKNAPILVLDEATSALDSESEKLIQASLENLMKNRTSIVIAHRLSTIAKLDRIIVLEDGAIIEDGSHTELLNKKGTYAKLWSHQSGGFIDE